MDGPQPQAVKSPDPENLLDVLMPDETTEPGCINISSHKDAAPVPTCHDCAPPPTENTTGRCTLLEMPQEVILRVMRYVVGSTRHIHFFTVHNAKRDDRFVRNVEQKYAGKPCCKDQLCYPDRLHRKHRQYEHLTAVASTCRLLNIAWNTIFYGENRFIFELGKYSHPFGRQTSLYPFKRKRSVYLRREFHMFEVPTIWPLTTHTFYFVRDLTVIAPVREEQLSVDEDMQALFRSAKHIIAEAASPNRYLRHLAVSLHVFQYPYMSGPFIYKKDLDGSYRIIGRSHEEWRRCWNVPKLTAWWKLWKALNGRVKNVHLGGVITDELKEHLEATLLSSTAEGVMTDDEQGQQGS